MFVTPENMRQQRGGTRDYGGKYNTPETQALRQKYGGGGGGTRGGGGSSASGLDFNAELQKITLGGDAEDAKYQRLAEQYIAELTNGSTDPAVVRSTLLDLGQLLYESGFVSENAAYNPNSVFNGLVNFFEQMESFGISRPSDAWAAFMGRAPSSAEERAKRVFQPPTRDPLREEVVRLTVADVYQQEMGRAPSDEELDRAVNSFRARENEWFDTADKISRYDFEEAQAPPGETRSAQVIQQRPSPAALTEANVEDTMEAQGYRAARAGLSLVRALSSGF